MKKVLVLATFCLACSLTTATAQTKVVKQVERIVKGDKPDLNQARTLIAPALTDPESKDDARTWYVAGSIEEKAVDLGKINMSLNKDVDEEAFYTALYNMFPLYLKADSLDQLPNAKGKVKRKFEKEIRKALQENVNFLVNGGSLYLDKKDFANAHKYFQTFMQLKKNPIFEGTPIATPDSLSMQIGFFSAYTASQMENNMKQAIAEYESIKDVDYRRNEVYQLLAGAYQSVNDSVNYVKTLEEGASTFNNDKFFLFNLINVYIRSGEHDKAKDFLEKAIAADPKNTQLYNVLGTVYEQGFKDVAKAEECFRKAIEIDPNYADAIIGLGRIYYNQAVAIQSEANALTDQKKYAALNNQAKDLFKKALPYFEKAVEIDKSNTEYLMALRGIYYNLQMDKKVAEIEALMKN